MKPVHESLKGDVVEGFAISFYSQKYASTFREGKEGYKPEKLEIIKEAPHWYRFESRLTGNPGVLTEFMETFVDLMDRDSVEVTEHCIRFRI